MEPFRRDKDLSEFNQSFCDNDRKTISDKFAALEVLVV